MTLFVYVDGSVRPKNPGRMGIGWVAVRDGLVLTEGRKRLGGGSNNRAELLAIRRGIASCTWLAEYSAGTDVEKAYVLSDSEWAIRVIEGRYRLRSMEHFDLVAGIRRTLERHPEVRLRHVKGHSGDEYNERADRLAYEAAAP